MVVYKGCGLSGSQPFLLPCGSGDELVCNPIAGHILYGCLNSILLLEGVFTNEEVCFAFFIFVAGVFICIAGAGIFC